MKHDVRKPDTVAKLIVAERVFVKMRDRLIANRERCILVGRHRTAS